MDAATGAVGSLATTADANAYPTGVNATGAVGILVLWSDVIPGQTTTYSAISPSQTPNWVDKVA
jgi:hypothetical protein